MDGAELSLHYLNMCKLKLGANSIGSLSCSDLRDDLCEKLGPTIIATTAITDHLNMSACKQMQN